MCEVVYTKFILFSFVDMAKLGRGKPSPWKERGAKGALSLGKRCVRLCVNSLMSQSLFAHAHVKRSLVTS